MSNTDASILSRFLPPRRPALIKGTGVMLPTDLEERAGSPADRELGQVVAWGRRRLSYGLREAYSIITIEVDRTSVRTH